MVENFQKSFQQFVLVQAVMGSPGSCPGPEQGGRHSRGGSSCLELWERSQLGEQTPGPTLALCATEASLLVFISLNNHALPLPDIVDLPVHFAVLTITFIYKARRFNLN